MTQIAQKRLYFSFAASASQENDVNDVYLDIPAALTAVNRKQYHQFTAKGDPLCYTVTVTALLTDRVLKFCTAPNTWTTRNAAKKTASGWKEQMKNSNIRMSELPTYARRFRCALDSGGVVSGSNAQTLYNHMVPDGCDGDRLFTPYDTPDETENSYFNTNEIVLLAIGEGATDDYKVCLTGGTAGDDFGMIHEYLKSRRNMRAESDPEAEFPDSDGLMNTLFAVSEELADDVVGAVDEYNIGRPYSETDASLQVMAAQVEAGTTNYRETFSCPLGLLKLASIQPLDEIFVDVEAVYEM